MMRRCSIPPSPEFEAAARGAPFRDVIAIVVTAPPEAIFQALREVTLCDMKIAWFLGQLRYLPSRLAGRMPAGRADGPFLSILTDGGTLVLRDDAPRELILGSAAQLHRVHQEPLQFANREAFDAFDDGGHEKLFMSVRVAPTGLPGEHWLVLEHATRALSPLTELKFARYWRVIKPMGAFVTWQLLRAVRRRAERAVVGGACSGHGKRLLVRARGGQGYRFLGWPLFLTKVLIRTVHFVMQRRQLLGIARRAEAHPASSPVSATTSRDAA